MKTGPLARRLPRLLGGAALLGLMTWIVGPRRLAAVLAQVNPGVFMLALVLSVASNVASAVRWARIATALGLAAPPLRLLPMYARGMTSNILLPGATLSGDMLRALELSRLGNPLLESTVSVAFDRFSGLWTLCVLSFAAAALASMSGLTLAAGAHGDSVLTTYGILLGVIVALPFLPWPITALARLPFAAAARLADLWARFRDPGTGLRRRLAGTLYLSLVVQALSALALAACGASIGLEAPLLLVIAAAAPVFVMAALPVGIAGFGTRELAAVAVLGLAGVGAEQAAATGLLYGTLGVIQGTLAAPLFLIPR
ncbi:MAG: lysylphosphatidylglycerol synthase transmembrane domain-containing protein [Betaproteobacteria bacterium]